MKCKMTLLMKCQIPTGLCTLEYVSYSSLKESFIEFFVTPYSAEGSVLLWVNQKITHEAGTGIW